MNDIRASSSLPPARDLNEHAAAERMTFGFWVYLTTDCVLFASLFAVYAVLHTSTFAGPTAHDLFSLPNAFAETLLLLTSSFTCGLAVLAAQRHAKSHVLFWLYITCLLGIVFLILEVTEFQHLIRDGNDWRQSGFLSSFFTLVGTHGLHIVIGLVWIVALAVKLGRTGLTAVNIRRLTLFSMFWHFLDVVWIFIFTIVYTFGVLRI